MRATLHQHSAYIGGQAFPCRCNGTGRGWNNGNPRFTKCRWGVRAEMVELAQKLEELQLLLDTIENLDRG